MEQIRQLASRFTADDLERCLRDEIATGDNLCVEDGSSEAIISALAEAEFVREQVDDGVPIRDAVRELARRVRAVQRGFVTDD
jgi:hypothetical protein